MEFKRLSGFKGEEEAWELVAEIIDPISEIATDKRIAKALTGESGEPKAEIAKYICKTYATPATQILALLAGIDYDTFRKEITPATIFVGVITILNDKEMISLFQSQGSMTAENSSGSAMEITTGAN